MNEKQPMTELEAVNALHAIRKPDESYSPCTFVEVEVWRSRDVCVTVTALDGMERFSRRIYGWVLRPEGTLCINGSMYQEALSCALDKLREAAL